MTYIVSELYIHSHMFYNRINTWWNRISNIGISKTMSYGEARYIIITNRASIITSVISFIFFVILLTNFGWKENSSLWLIVLSILCYLAIPILNKYTLYETAKMLFVYLVPIFCIVISVYSKAISPGVYLINDYFNYRIIILSSSIFPLLIYSSKRWKAMAFGLLPSLLTNVFYDPIHNFFGVGFHQVGYQDEAYFMTTVVTVVIYFGLVGFILTLKVLSDRFEDELGKKNKVLEKKNTELSALTEQVDAQNRKLKEANKLIHDQKKLLEHQNLDLEQQVLEKTKNLSEANKELVLSNNELRQFSFALSHNLKAPVASIKGLFHILDHHKIKKQNIEAFEHLKKSIYKLDEIYTDLSRIVNLRHELSNINQKTNLEEEIESIRRLLIRDIEEFGVNIIENFEKPAILFTNKQKIHSILFNLISNAIKYRNPNRNPEIEITWNERRNHYLLSVTDNGLGIDLNQYGAKIFQLYMRFHEHIEGKGMGLYLIKSQVESLGGHIEVESEVDKFTKFKIFIKKPIRISEQLIFDNENVKVYFDAELNAIFFKSKKGVIRDEFKDVIYQVISFIRAHHTANLILEGDHRHFQNAENQLWIEQEIVKNYEATVLKNMIFIESDLGEDYRDSIKSTLHFVAEHLGVNFYVVKSMNEVKKLLIPLHKVQ